MTHNLATAWSPAVIAAVIASLLTYAGSTWRDIRQRRRDAKAALRRDRASAYGDLLTHSFSVASTIQTVRASLPLRSGLKEGVNAVLRYSKPMDPFMLHDWLDKAYGPMHTAWSRVWVVGSQEAMIAADRLIDSCADLMNLATTYETKGLRLSVRGVAWTVAEQAAYDKALLRFSEERVVFAKLMRTELGMDSVEFTMERLRREAAIDKPVEPAELPIAPALDPAPSS